MAGEWRASTWGDEITLEYGKALRGHEGRRGPYRVYGANGPIGWTSEPLVAGPGVILGRKGAYRGVAFSRDPFFVIDTAYYVVPKTALDIRWVYYAIKHYKLGEVNDGSPIPSTTRAAVSVLDVDVPPLNEQRTIAHILGTLDDKIELNRRMSETLDAMARALFKSWFADFDPVRAKSHGRDPGLPRRIAGLFPDSFEGSVPEGWRVTSVGEVCSRIAMGPFGSDIKTENFVESGVPVIRGSNLRDGFLDDQFVYLTEAKATELKNANALAGDIVITHRGTLGQIGLIPQNHRFRRYVVSQSQMLLSFAPESRLSMYVYMYLRSPAGQHALLANTNQTGVPAIARPTVSVKSIPLLLPPKPALEAFDCAVAALHRRLYQSARESRALAAVRDALLPELISGGLRVKESQEFGRG